MYVHGGFGFIVSEAQWRDGAVRSFHENVEIEGMRGGGIVKILYM